MAHHGAPAGRGGGTIARMTLPARAAPQADRLQAAVAAARRPAPAAEAARASVLALGMVGALGEELLALLVANADYRRVHVGVTQPIASAATRFSPWRVGHGTPVVDEAFICLLGPDVVIPKASPIRTVEAAEVLQFAALARDAGARRLVLVSPLAALLQISAAVRTLASIDEVKLAALGFEQLVIVRPTAADVAARGTNWLRRLIASAGKAMLDLMLPPHTRVLSARNAALAILAAVRAAAPGVTVVGAKELAGIVEATLPAAARRKRPW
jgi:hypothetical protein